MVAKSCINLIEGCDENTKRVSNGFSMFQQSVWWCRISQPSTVWRNHLLNQEIGSLTWFDMIEPSWMEFLQAVKITNARRTIGPIGMVYIYMIIWYLMCIYIPSNYIYTHSSKIICRYRVIYIILYIYVVDQTGCESVKSAKQSWHLMTIQLGRSAYDQPFLPVNSLNRSHCHTFIHIQSIAD